jgi:hypothetical protein
VGLGNAVAENGSGFGQRHQTIGVATHAGLQRPEAETCLKAYRRRLRQEAARPGS